MDLVEIAKERADRIAELDQQLAALKAEREGMVLVNLEPLKDVLLMCRTYIRENQLVGFGPRSWEVVSADVAVHEGKQADAQQGGGNE